MIYMSEEFDLSLKLGAPVREDGHGPRDRGDRLRGDRATAPRQQHGHGEGAAVLQ